MENALEVAGQAGPSKSQAQKINLERRMTFANFEMCPAAYFEELREDGGEGGIRTRVGVFSPQTAFEAAPLRPLRYLSVG